MQSQSTVAPDSNTAKTHVLASKAHGQGTGDKRVSERPYSYLVNLCLSFQDSILDL